MSKRLIYATEWLYDLDGWVAALETMVVTRRRLCAPVLEKADRTMEPTQTAIRTGHLDILTMAEDKENGRT